MQAASFEEAIDLIVKRDPRFHKDAYAFVREALDYTQKVVEKPTKKSEVNHITGQQLLEGIRNYGLKLFGPMTLTVLHEWGLTSCEGFGEIVFNMVEANLLAKTDSDTRQDFKGGYDFQDAFRRPFLPSKALSALEPEPKSTQV